MTLKRLFAAALSAPLLVLVPTAHAQTKAALTRDVDRPAAQPVSGKCTGSTFTDSFKCTLYTVPMGKRLVVELVSQRLISLPTQAVTLLQFGRNDQALSSFSDGDKVYSVNLGSSVTFNGSFSTHFGSTSLRFYLDEGDQLAGSAVFSSYFGSAAQVQTFAFSGYLVDK